MLPPPLLPLLLLAATHTRPASAEDRNYVHSSPSPFGPWTPVTSACGGNESAGLWAPVSSPNWDSIPAYAAPFIVDSDVAAVTGLPNGTVVVITNGGYCQPTVPPVHDECVNPPFSQDHIAVGLAPSWRDPVVLHPQPLFNFSLHANAYRNYTGDSWEAWSLEGPMIYFDKRLERWRVLFHQFKKAGLRPGDSWDIRSGGYAESTTANLFGAWVANSPSVGAGYTKHVNISTASAASAVPPRASATGHSDAPPGTKAPFQYGASRVLYRNDSMTTWGGNVVEDDTGAFHLFVAGFVGGCGLGGWELNSQIIHAVGSHPAGPFNFSDVALPVWHHNPHTIRDPATGTYLLYTVGCGYGACKGCHKGACGSVRCHEKPLGPPPHGATILSRRERPKLFLDKDGVPRYLYNGVQPSGNDRVFTLVTPILDPGYPPPQTPL